MTSPFLTSPMATPKESSPKTRTHLTPKELILERLRVSKDPARKARIYALRRIAANILDLDSYQPNLSEEISDYPDLVPSIYEEGRHNQVAVNTQIQAKSLVFNLPNPRWSNVADPVISEIRAAYFKERWRKLRYDLMYREVLMDALICGEGNIDLGVRGGEPFQEWGNTLEITWDPSYRHPHEKRYRFREKCLPLGDALTFYPALASKIPLHSPKDAEKNVKITVYFDETTKAVLYRNEFLEWTLNPYGGRIPGIMLPLFLKPSIKYPTGLVEEQLGLHRLMLRLQRKFREVARRTGSPVGVATGNFNEADLDELSSGKEGVILRSPAPTSSFRWEPGGEISNTELLLYKMMEQWLNATSGVHEFQQGRTDTQVEFATQLGLLAQMSGVQGKYVQIVFEEMIKESILWEMRLAKWNDSPMSLVIQNTLIEFDEFNPIQPFLGTDGELELAPGGTSYKSPAQKLQEAIVLAQALALSNSLPQPIQPLYLDLVLQAAEVQNKNEWLENLERVQKEAQAFEKQLAQINAAEEEGNA